MFRRGKKKGPNGKLSVDVCPGEENRRKKNGVQKKNSLIHTKAVILLAGGEKQRMAETKDCSPLQLRTPSDQQKPHKTIIAPSIINALL